MVRHKKLGTKKRKKLHLTPGDKEALAVIAQRKNRGPHRSKSQVKQRGKGEKYKIQRKDRQENPHIFDYQIRKIEKVEDWQFGDSDGLNGILAELEKQKIGKTIVEPNRHLYYMPKEVYYKKESKVKHKKEKFLSEDLQERSFEQLLALMAQQEQESKKVAPPASSSHLEKAQAKFKKFL